MFDVCSQGPRSYFESGGGGGGGEADKWLFITLKKLGAEVPPLPLCLFPSGDPGSVYIVSSKSSNRTKRTKLEEFQFFL